MYTTNSSNISDVLIKWRTPESPSWPEQEKQKTPNTQKETPRFLPYHPEPSLQWLNALFIDWVDPEKQQQRWKVAINTVIVNGEIWYKLESWWRSCSFQIMRDTQQNNQLYIKVRDDWFVPVKSMEHVLQVTNLANFIANKTLWLKNGIWNLTFNDTLNRQTEPVVNQWSKLIFKWTINDTILYSGNNPDFITPAIAEFLSSTVNDFLKNHKPFSWSSETVLSDTGNNWWDLKDILKKLQNI